LKIQTMFGQKLTLCCVI